MELRPIDVRLPQPRGETDHMFAPSSDVLFAEAAIVDEFRQANQSVIPGPVVARHLIQKKKQPSRDSVLLVAALVIGLIMSLALNVELIVIRASHAPAPLPAVNLVNASAQVDLSNIARAESGYFTRFSTYTTDSKALGGAGYQPVPETDVAVWVGVDNGNGFCAAAGASSGAAWFLYDSGRGGFVNHSYATEQAAQLACTQHSSTGFILIT